MRHLIIGVVAGMFPLYSAFADIPADIESGQPMQTIFENAIASGEAVQSTLGSVIGLRADLGGPALCTAVTLDAENAADLATFALDQGLAPNVVVTSAMQCAGDQAAAIYSAMQKKGVSEEDLLASAIEAGQDPTLLQEATAAGNAQGQGRGLGIAPGQTGRAVTPPPFGSNAGGGGGGTGSPS